MRYTPHLLAVLALIVVIVSIVLILDNKNIVATIDGPSQEVYGHRPVSFSVNVKNPNLLSPRKFSYEIWIGGPAWSRETDPISMTQNSRLDNQICNNGCTLFWSGEVAAGQEAILLIPTFTGVELGTSKIISVTSQSGVITEKTLTLVEGTEPASAEVVLRDSVWKPGAYNALTLTLTGPHLTQFSSNVGLASTCGLDGLQNTMVYGHNDRTWEQISAFAILLPENAAPGDCIISGQVNLADGTSVPVEYSFVIP